jgi:hypothetical protein
MENGLHVYDEEVNTHHQRGTRFEAEGYLRIERTKEE